uniref:Growth-regulating factor n=1 Tax=Oryza brachyantha TaxID=4533 RepID=J3LFU8_ORYBR
MGEEKEADSPQPPSKLPRLSAADPNAGMVTMAAPPPPVGLGLGLGLGGDSRGERDVEPSPASAPAHKATVLTFMQQQELEHQVLIYRYFAAGAPVPVHLVLPIWKSVASSSFGPHRFPSLMGLGNLCFDYRSSMEPDPGRCRRTDGKKWRCSRDVVPGHKRGCCSASHSRMETVIVVSVYWYTEHDADHDNACFDIANYRYNNNDDGSGVLSALTSSSGSRGEGRDNPNIDSALDCHQLAELIGPGWRLQQRLLARFPLEPDLSYRLDRKRKRQSVRSGFSVTFSTLYKALALIKIELKLEGAKQTLPEECLHDDLVIPQSHIDRRKLRVKAPLTCESPEATGLYAAPFMLGH